MLCSVYIDIVLSGKPLPAYLWSLIKCICALSLFVEWHFFWCSGHAIMSDLICHCVSSAKVWYVVALLWDNHNGFSPRFLLITVLWYILPPFVLNHLIVLTNYLAKNIYYGRMKFMLMPTCVVELGQMVSWHHTVSVSNFRSIECRLDSSIISLYLDTNTYFVNSILCRDFQIIIYGSLSL